VSTSDGTTGLEEPHPEPTRGRRGPLVAGIVALVAIVAAAGIAYAVGSSNSDTKVVTRTVTMTPTTAKPLNCVPGAAKGSCNTDEFLESQIPDKPLSASQRSEIAAQLVAAREAAMKYPTVGDARAAHMLQAGKFSPEVGAHFINIGSYFGGFDPSSPGSYIYDGVSDTSKVVGVMYISGAKEPPEGFAGPNDHWHRHRNTCVVYANGGIQVPFPADSDVTKRMCDKEHGNFMRQTVWMVHSWVVPGWESPDGVFSHNNTDVKCADGTTKVNAAGFCKGT
jgi:hypothetical protein